MSAKATVSTPIPEGVSAESVIKTLHNHEAYIKATCPALISHKLESGDPAASGPCVYQVTDKKPIGQTTFSLTLTNVADGVDTLVQAKLPTGAATIKGKWRVADGKLTEDVEIEGNLLSRNIIKKNVEKSHPDHHKTLIGEAQKA